MIEAQNGVDPIFSVLGVDRRFDDPFEDVTVPFLVVERGPGGHAPYAETETAQEYFRSRSGASRKTLQSEYRSAVRRDADRFECRLSTLRDRGLLKETLVIYTSDHGELLGEGGSVGHNAPMRPELVYVPTMFVHPSLDDVDDDRGFRHIDLAPTLLAALGEDGALGEIDGAVGGDSQPGCSFYNNRVFAGYQGVSLCLSYDGVWTTNGGHVFPRSGLLERLAVLAGKLAKSPKRGYLWRHLPTAVRSYAAADQTYGAPDVTRAQADQLLAETYDMSDVTAGQSGEVTSLSEEASERLEDMGYI